MAYWSWWYDLGYIYIYSLIKGVLGPLGEARVWKALYFQVLHVGMGLLRFGG